MKIKTRSLVILLIGFVIISGCSPESSEVDLQGTQEQVQNTHQAETAVFETSVVVLLTERAPTATLTQTASPTLTMTLVPSQTPTITATVYKNPWVFQDICVTDPTACVRYSIDNRKNDIWIQVTLIHVDTGDTGFFSIRPKTMGTITLVPGKYSALYTAFCRWENTISRTRYIGASTDSFLCRKKGLPPFINN